MFPALAADPAGLHEHQGQGQPGISPAVALPAAHRILEQQKPLNIFHAET
jgi:hypothetical protein